MRREAGVDVSHVKRTDQAPSAIGNVQLFQRSDGSTQNRIVVVPGANLLLTQADVAFLREKIGGFDMVMLQLEIPLPVNIAVARYARAAGVPVMLNPAPAAPLPADLLSAVTYLSPNENEAELLSGVPLHRTEHGIDLKRVEHAAAVLRDKGAAHVIVTLGDVGSAYLGKEFLHCPSVSGIQAIDPTAAGDSYIGALSVALAGGEPGGRGHAPGLPTPQPSRSPAWGRFPRCPPWRKWKSRWPGAASPNFKSVLRRCLLWNP